MFYNIKIKSKIIGSTPEKWVRSGLIFASDKGNNDKYYKH